MRGGEERREEGGEERKSNEEKIRERREEEQRVRRLEAILHYCKQEQLHGGGRAN